MLTIYENSVLALQDEMKWLQRVLDFRLSVFENKPYSEHDPITGKFLTRSRMEEICAPDLQEGIPLHRYLLQHPEYEYADRVLIALGLASHISPQVFAKLLSCRKKDASGLPQAGGVSTAQYGGFIPTGLTWLWIAGADKTAEYARQLRRLFNNHPVLESGIIHIGGWEDTEPAGSGPIILDRKFLMEILA